MLLTIDYLIINLKGSLTPRLKGGSNAYREDSVNPFELVRHERGNKTFSEMYDLFEDGERIGILNAVPHSKIIASDLIQFQFENHLFYKRRLQDLSQLVYKLCDYFAVDFFGINRLDIALDKKENSLKYKTLYTDLITGKKLVKGREKNIGSYSLTKKGRAQFNGFTVGKRSSSRFLRIYNKTEALKEPSQTKEYITEYHKEYGLEASAGLDIWRFEYQLNSSFFTFLEKYGKKMTYQIFEKETLIDLLKMAEKNHFEIVENTGKAETNKEKPIVLHDWSSLYNSLKNKVEYFVSKVKRVFETSSVVQKRLCKSLFRQYYINQHYDYLLALIRVINEYKLKSWFENKYQFYVHEFMAKEKLKGNFEEAYFLEEFYEMTDDYSEDIKPINNNPVFPLVDLF